MWQILNKAGDYACVHAGGPEVSRHCIQIPTRRDGDAPRRSVITQTSRTPARSPHLETLPFNSGEHCNNVRYS